MAWLYHFVFRLTALLSLLIMLLVAPSALACGETYSRCVELDSLWISPDPSELLVVSTLPELELAPVHARVLGSWLLRPLTVTAPAPDPLGTDLRVVENLLTVQAALSYAIAGRLRLGAVLPAGLLASGVGAEALTSQTASPGLGGIGSPRVGVSWGLVIPPAGGGTTQELRLSARVLAPWGSEASWAKSPGWALAPSANWGIRWARLTLGAKVGLRSRPKARFADAAFGSQVIAALGAHQRFGAFGLSLEAWAAPSLTRLETTRSGVLRSTRRVPAEWLLSGHYDLTPLSLALGIGGGIPVSHEITEDATGTSKALVLAAGTAQFRTIVGLQTHF